jgi:hypothetical protein
VLYIATSARDRNSTALEPIPKPQPSNRIGFIKPQPSNQEATVMLAEVGVLLLKRDATVTIKRSIVTNGDYLFAGLDLGHMTSNYLGNSLAASRDSMETLLSTLSLGRMVPGAHPCRIRELSTLRTCAQEMGN